MEGLYEELITKELNARLDKLQSDGWAVGRLPVGKESSPHVLADHVADQVRRRLSTLSPDQQVTVTNRILSSLAKPDGAEDPVEPDIDPSDDETTPMRLAALSRGKELGIYAHRPATPLTETALITNMPEDPRLGPELRQEITTADRIDLLCAFVKWSGLRLLEEPLAMAHERGVPIRVLTTTYIGATERRALDRLVRRFGAEVKINYEQLSTRLHAKAWLFRRNTGYDTAYVGSSNLSKPALLDGLEWNVRLSTRATPDVMKKFELTFDAYWESPTFDDYDPDHDAARLDEALAAAGGTGMGSGRQVQLSGLNVRPYPHQRDMLERLETARTVHGHYRNLLVAATGTGKTVMAGLDYKRLRELYSRDLKLLFIAHRQEILVQSMRTYQDVLNDHDLGEILAGGVSPTERTHVFASVQSLEKTKRLESFSPDHFDVIVIDEFHHGAAKTYRRVVDYFKPKELLGLTATPERTDGTKIHDLYFDGRITAELRLWEALENELLSPFHYFGISDNTDLTAVTWKRGGYDTDELESLFTGNDARARLILTAVREKVTDPGSMRALGFCVSIAHAEYMARCFREAGLAATALSAATDVTTRREALAKLKDGELQVIFSVDLLNEGVDIPDVDTLLLLRPTSSATVFLQQLGRGLRRTANKPVLTVLDFIGQHRAEFRFEEQFHALTGQSRRRLQESVEADFPRLPAGCQILLERKAKDTILNNIKAQIGVNVRALAHEVRAYGTSDLAEYLHESGRSIEQIYRAKNSWTGILRRAGLLPATAPSGEKELLGRVASLLHVDDPLRRDHYRMMLADDAPRYEELDGQGQAYARMLYFSLWDRKNSFVHYQEGFDELQRHPDVRRELRQVLDYGLNHAEHVPHPLLNGIASLPLAVHASYNRSEIVAALGQAKIGVYYPSNFREGVKWCPEIKTDALLITSEKDEKDFSPQTRYKDVALSETLFHWESQNSTSSTTETGLRYQNHRREGSQVLLFIRQFNSNDIGGAQPWMLLGPATYIKHEGDNPMGITWKLTYPLPADVWNYAAIAAS
ncbi:DUF3427 domain-containing protein [Nocardiopsis gilva YIM 90087]|uniref:DUF3427 domain-containing protein n=1 Tax=Nocardiopsis gilva YIM 90087 TaxID=1235441 RepID=A0A223S3E1_9ACTN|nr:DEAD/DEAH box helicase [Nocardiopsis gilva]ASU82638.1 DUF3427 domain-containing protein [Nocardiopsis gilva YIM 90087]